MQCDLWLPEVRIPVAADKAWGVARAGDGLLAAIGRCSGPKALFHGKGVVERVNQFLKTAFLPGRIFTSLEDFNDQLGQWLPKAKTSWSGELAPPGGSPRCGQSRDACAATSRWFQRQCPLCLDDVYGPGYLGD